MKMLELRNIIRAEREAAVISYRDWASTEGRPVAAMPDKQPMSACKGCGSRYYAEWTLWPHQVYNSVCPAGVGTHCLPCFAKKLVENPEAMKLLGMRGRTVS